LAFLYPAVLSTCHTRRTINSHAYNTYSQEYKREPPGGLWHFPNVKQFIDRAGRAGVFRRTPVDVAGLLAARPAAQASWFRRHHHALVGLPVAACLTGLLLFPQLGLSSDPHLLPVEDDSDEDYLSYAEEIIRGYRPRTSDMNGDGILDGINEAQLLDSLIAALPISAQTDQPYRIDMQTDGVEYCQVCGTPTDMGFVTIVNPLRNMEIDIPYMCLHYLEHEIADGSGQEEAIDHVEHAPETGYDAGGILGAKLPFYL